ncbi:uncharacterized protein VICG_00378 [Vittaforma corneae ATCC 50505]|uniref:Anaphase-promoting complex subunit 4 WD40 domain-containing protein n=1 Tax=Vittaforma corneae (strain ATCC 50505) TaxID=993615 RepID=L2GP79_VITCO|nr:uncharacterized protein VICG_00378 [Vittaforma corneae ATCC 50505]ELA42626.1 hypothetical protein VICG_00378 [Vittaforma corneae ATCC 50505]
MKIESIYHSKEARRKECKGDKSDRRYSKDPVHHPMLLEREYVRALNAVKIERMLSKPFITALSHHREGINRLSKDYSSNVFVSSSYDNKVVVWDLFYKNIIFEKKYEGLINGIAVNTTDNKNNIFVSQNKKVILENSLEFAVESPVSGIDFSQDLCVGHSLGISIFDVDRITPKISYLNDDITFVKYNRSFKYIIAGLSRLAIDLYDNRSSKGFMQIDHSGANCVSFNPQQGYLFACGNEDGNGYLYDIRNSIKPIETYRGHTNAVVSISFSPDGKEVVTGSFDRTIRIFKMDERKPGIATTTIECKLCMQLNIQMMEALSFLVATMGLCDSGKLTPVKRQDLSQGLKKSH